MKMWVLIGPRGNIIAWSGASHTRSEMMKRAVTGCIGADEYYKASSDSSRWKIAYSRGYRLRKASVELSP